MNAAYSLQTRAAAALELRKRQQASARTFQDFVGKVNPRFVFYRHCDVLAGVCDRVVRGELKRVMIFCPPRHSKSETISRLFTAYYLACHPSRWVGLSSYAADLAFTLSRAARENFAAGGGQIKESAGAVKHWESVQGGGFWAAGVGGPITGKGFHLGVIDDPLKNAEEANSALVREKQKEWYRSTFYTRQEPDAAIVCIQTRWHEDDLSGWLLSEEAGEEPERWHIVNLPAIAEAPPKIPPTCTLEPDWRENGAALCEERYPVPKLHQVRARVGEYYFNALYQQRPVAKEGAFFKVAMLGVPVAAAPANLKIYRAWDLAASAGTGDYTVGAKIGVDANGLFYILDIVRGQWSPDERNALLRQTAALDGRSVKIRLAQDPGQAGKEQAEQLTRLLAGYSVKAERVSGDKVTRADGFAAQVNAGNVRILQGAWNALLIEEMRQFPFGKHDDQIDALADGFNELAHPTAWAYSKFRV